MDRRDFLKALGALVAGSSLVDPVSAETVSATLDQRSWPPYPVEIHWAFEAPGLARRDPSEIQEFWGGVNSEPFAGFDVGTVRVHWITRIIDWVEGPTVRDEVTKQNWKTQVKGSKADRYILDFVQSLSGWKGLPTWALHQPRSFRASDFFLDGTTPIVSGIRSCLIMPDGRRILHEMDCTTGYHK